MDSAIYGWLLGKKEWRDFREDVFVGRGRCCEVEGCGKTGDLEIHHTVYRKGHLPWEYSFDDVRVYCHAHHMELHRKWDIIGSGPKTEEGFRKVKPELLCPRCGGTGFLLEYQDLVGGKCMGCFGLTRVLPEKLPPEFCLSVAREFWEDWKEKHIGGLESREGNVFCGLLNVFDWVCGLQGYTEEERNEFRFFLDAEES